MVAADGVETGAVDDTAAGVVDGVETGAVDNAGVATGKVGIGTADAAADGVETGATGAAAVVQQSQLFTKSPIAVKIEETKALILLARS